jgi:cell division protein FtsQ
LSAQVNQIYLREDGDFILIPQIGDQIIVFGQANSDSEVVEKFEKLITFYKEGIQYEGWDKYSEINLKFNGQIVCKKK